MLQGDIGALRRLKGRLISVLRGGKEIKCFEAENNNTIICSYRGELYSTRQLDRISKEFSGRYCKTIIFKPKN